MSLKKQILFVIVIIASVHPCLSEEPRMITLEECLTIALQNHPEIKSAYEHQDSAAAGYRISLSGNKVSVNASAKTVEYLNPDRSQGQVNIPGRDTTIGLFAGLAASYRLYDPTVSKTIDISRLNVDISKINTAQIKNRVMLNVKKAYYSYGMAREMTGFREIMMKKHEERLAKNRILNRIGQKSVLEVSKSELDLETAKLEYERSESNEYLKKANLLTNMGIMADNVEFLPVINLELSELRYSIDELYNLFQTHSIDSISMDLKKRIGKLNIELQKSQNYPRVDIQAAFGFENKSLQDRDSVESAAKGNDWDPTFHAGFSAAIPIYTGGAIGGKIDQAVAEYNTILYDEKKMNIGIKSSIRANYNLLNDLSKQIHMSKFMVRNAEKHLDLTQRYYENGVGSILDVRDAEMSLINSQLNSVKALYEYMITLADISHAVGLKEEQICKQK